MKLIEGKVAAFVGERQITIDIGRRQGVRVGMVFAVLPSDHSTIDEPEITRVQAIDVQDYKTVCASYTATPATSLADALEALLEPRPPLRRPRVGSPWGGLPTLNATDRYVRIGDRVRQVEGA